MREPVKDAHTGNSRWPRPSQKGIWQGWNILRAVMLLPPVFIIQA
jgi:hypothetical protein